MYNAIIYRIKFYYIIERIWEKLKEDIIICTLDTPFKLLHREKNVIGRMRES